MWKRPSDPRTRVTRADLRLARASYIALALGTIALSWACIGAVGPSAQRFETSLETPFGPR